VAAVAMAAQQQRPQKEWLRHCCNVLNNSAIQELCSQKVPVTVFSFTVFIAVSHLKLLLTGSCTIISIAPQLFIKVQEGMYPSMLQQGLTCGATLHAAMEMLLNKQGPSGKAK